MRKILFAFSLILLGLAFVAYMPGTFVWEKANPWPGVTVDVQDYSLTEFAPLWRTEIARRFPDAVAILAHGGDRVDGLWMSSADAYGHSVLVTDLVKRAQRNHPGRTIVVLCCNEGRLKLGIKGVWYSPANVWCVPDHAVTDPMVKKNEMETMDSVLPFPGLPFPLIFPTTAPVSVKQKIPRWEKDPSGVGNIYEFIQD